MGDPRFEFSKTIALVVPNVDMMQVVQMFNLPLGDALQFQDLPYSVCGQKAHVATHQVFRVVTKLYRKTGPVKSSQITMSQEPLHKKKGRFSAALDSFDLERNA